MPDNQGEVIKALPGPDDLARVAIVKRPDDYYAIRPEKWYRNVWDDHVIVERWLPVSQGSGIFESVASAETAAYFDYPWMKPKGN